MTSPSLHSPAIMMLSLSNTNTNLIPICNLPDFVEGRKWWDCLCNLWNHFSNQGTYSCA